MLEQVLGYLGIRPPGTYSRTVKGDGIAAVIIEPMKILAGSIFPIPVTASRCATSGTSTESRSHSTRDLHRSSPRFGW
jgi:hypothetical protein